MRCYLEQGRKHVEGVHGAGAVRVSHQLVDVAPPGLLCIVARGWLECRQDGGEEGRWWRRRAALQELVPLLLSQAGRPQKVRLRSGVGRSGSFSGWLVGGRLPGRVDVRVELPSAGGKNQVGRQRVAVVQLWRRLTDGERDVFLQDGGVYVFLGRLTLGK